MPFPVIETVTLGVQRASELIVRFVLIVLADDGLNLTVNVQLLPDVMIGDVLPHGFEPPFTFRAKFVVSDRFADETMRFAVPALTMAISSPDDELPTVISPKLWLVGNTEMYGPGKLGKFSRP